MKYLRNEISNLVINLNVMIIDLLIIKIVN
jgi:hypothetical protein